MSFKAGAGNSNVCPRLFGPTSPSCLVEAVAGNAASGVEPHTFVGQWITASGIAPKSGLAGEFSMHVHSLFYLATADRFDLSQSSGAEHIARRLIQIQKAVQRDHQKPNFVGLQYYTQHCDDLSGTLQTPAFDRYIAEEAKVEANVLKQFRLSREELEKASDKKNESDKKDKKKSKGEGKGE